MWRGTDSPTFGPRHQDIALPLAVPRRDPEDQRLSQALGTPLFDSSQDCVKAVDLDGRLLGMNANGICLMEIEDFSALRGLAWSSLWPPEHQAAIDAAVVHARQGGVARLTADCPTAKGTMKSWEVLVSPVNDEAGRPTVLLAISRDVTAQVRAQAERDLVSREPAHRIRNMFAVVDGVVALSARAAPAAQAFSRDLRERLRSLGVAVASIYPELRELDSGQTLLPLLQLLLAPYGADGRADRPIEIVGEDVPLGHGAVTAIALVMNELATNAVKYGALSVETGTVAVAITAQADKVTLTWREAGVEGLVAASDDAGFGSTLLDMAVSRQLGGTLSRDWLPDGLKITLQLSRAALAA
jgi:PAS domain S-box-containing protein